MNDAKYLVDPVDPSRLTDIEGPCLEVVAALVVRDGRLFLTRRAQGLSDAGLWELPGGKVEPGESTSQALLRELHEELSVTACIEGAPEVWKFSLQEQNAQFTVYPVSFLTAPVLSSSHDSLIWLKPEELSDFKLASFDGPPVMSWVNKMNSSSTGNDRKDPQQLH